METKIFKTREDFLNREDKDVNGVSEEFAKDYPDYEKKNETNEACWNCSDCSCCSDCSGCRGCSDLGFKHDIKAEKDVTNETTSEIASRSSFPGVPIIENIRQKILEAVTAIDHKLEMGSWHVCETTHCRAGWVVQLAGNEGFELERKTSTQFAAMRIYKNSSDIRVSPNKFFDSDEVAMEDIKACAEKEIEANNKK